MALPLKTIFYRNSFSCTNPLQLLVKMFFENAPIERQLIEKVLSCDPLSTPASPLAILEKWRDLLTVVLVLRAKDCLEPLLRSAVKRYRRLIGCSVWPEFQLTAAYQALAAFLLKQPAPKLECFQLPSGACPLEKEGYHPEGEVPCPLFQAELGILFSIYADLTNEVEYLMAAEKLAEWQQNGLDHHFRAFFGLFAKEGEVSESSLLPSNFLLFDAVAKAASRSDFAFIAKKQEEQLITRFEELEIPAYLAVLEDFFAEKGQVALSEDHRLPAVVNDANLALIGSRSSETSAVATLFGGRSGMGCMHHHDIRIVSFGPQHQPLDDCRGFGLEGSARFLGGYVKCLSATEEEFLAAGVVRMSPPVDKQPSGIWMESSQLFRRGCLDIQTTIQKLLWEDPLAFSFFVKCKNCIVGEQTIKPRSFDRYIGRSEVLQLQGTSTNLSLKAGQSHEEMHIVPLPGDKNYWGADFLISYLLTENSNSWRLRPCAE